MCLFCQFLKSFFVKKIKQIYTKKYLKTNFFLQKVFFTEKKITLLTFSKPAELLIG